MRKKSKGKRVVCASAMFTVAIIVVAVFIIGIAPVSAEIASVTRSIPVCVATNAEFEVTLTQTEFFMSMGTVVETLPAGFEYVAGSYTGSGDDEYNDATRELTLDFRKDVDVSYRVKASGNPKLAEFEGAYFTVVPNPDWDPSDPESPIVISESGNVGGNHEICVDAAPPYTDGHDPAKSATGVPVDTNIVVHIRDDCYIVPTSIVMTVDGINVTSSLDLLPLDLGHYRVTYDPPADFDEGQTVDVTVDAKDCVGNAMIQDVYSFTTGSTIIDYYRSQGSNPTVVETGDLLKAADDWREDITPPGFTAPITTQELLQLADEWRST